MIRRTIALALAAGLAVGAAAVELAEDSPPVPAPRAGDVTGAIEPAAQIATLKAVSRATGKTYLPDSLNKNTGRFVFKGLPGQAAYDICLTTADGRTFEGIDLGFVDERMLELAAERRRQLSLPQEREPAFGQRDVEELVKFVADLKDFMEIRRVLYLRGQGRRATMLVELMRAREFFAQKGSELIWRVELWYFENRFGGWERLANQERVLRRERVPQAAWTKIAIEWRPQLTARVRSDGTSEPVRFEIPAAPDPSRGRPANTDIELKTVPHVLGLEADSQPANDERP
jgi:hypothetical protein